VNGSKVYYYARHRRDPQTEERLGVEYLPLEELTRRCHIVSLHLPATKDSYHLVDEAFLASMQPGAFLVNTARGAIVDNEALCGAIRSGHLAGAALDTYDPEPVPSDHPLLALAAEYPDALILCPHQGGDTIGAFQTVYRMLFENLGKLMAGQRPDHIVNGL
jgi:D-3-phosphoglycerate dehydrogenase